MYFCHVYSSILQVKLVSCPTAKKIQRFGMLMKTYVQIHRCSFFITLNAMLTHYACLMCFQALIHTSEVGHCNLYASIGLLKGHKAEGSEIPDI